LPSAQQGLTLLGQSRISAAPLWWHIEPQILLLDAPCDECAIRLMKDHFIDDRAFTPKFDDESIQLDDPKSSTVMSAGTGEVDPKPPSPTQDHCDASTRCGVLRELVFSWHLLFLQGGVQ
jgi:hypothetical protein